MCTVVPLCIRARRRSPCPLHSDTTLPYTRARSAATHLHSIWRMVSDHALRAQRREYGASNRDPLFSALIFRGLASWMSADDGQLDYAGSASSSIGQAPTSEFTCLIDYYASNQLYGRLRRVCDDVLAHTHNDETAFWRAVGLSDENALTEAIRELDPLQHVPRLALGATVTLIHTYGTNTTPQEKETLEKLEEQLTELWKDVEISALIFVGRYLLNVGDAKNARTCLEQVHAQDATNVQTLVMLGWLNLNSGQSCQARQALNFFEAALKLTKEKQDIGALLGRSKYYERSAKSGASGEGASSATRKKWDRVLDDLNTIIVLYPNFTPAVIEKSRVLMIMNQWEESLQTAQRVLKKDAKDIGALRLVVLYFLTRESKGANIQNRLNDLMEAIETNEPRNHLLMYDIAQLVARLANRKKPVLQQTLVLIERACKMEPSNSAYLTEQGYQLMLLDDFAQASLCFQEASKLDEGNISSLSGLIKCKILQGNYKDAQQELDFLAEISASIGSNADLTFLHALLAWFKDANESKCMEYLNLAMTEHAKALEEIPLGFAYFITYNPDFVLEVIQMYMQHIGTEPMTAGDPPNAVLNTCIKLLHDLTEIVPGMLGAQLMLSKTNFIAGHFDESERALVTALRLDAQCAPAHIIQAQICLHRENFQQCSQSLEQARSLDSDIGDTPTYRLLQAKALVASDQLGDAFKALQAAMLLSGVRKISPSAMKSASALSNTGGSAKGVVPLQDRISIFLELASFYALVGDHGSASRVMAEAKTEFTHSSEATRILFADADLATKRGDFDAALQMLKSIPPNSSYATRAKIKMAEIYLHSKSDQTVRNLSAQFASIDLGTKPPSTEPDAKPKAVRVFVRRWQPTASCAGAELLVVNFADLTEQIRALFFPTVAGAPSWTIYWVPVGKTRTWFADKQTVRDDDSFAEYIRYHHDQAFVKRPTLLLFAPASDCDDPAHSDNVCTHSPDKVPVTGMEAHPVSPARSESSSTVMPASTVTSSARPEQNVFRDQLARRDANQCVVCKESIGLEATHVVPKGSARSDEEFPRSGLGFIDDVRNGLLLCHHHHKCFDSGLWYIEPAGDLSSEIVASNAMKKHDPNFKLLFDKARVPDGDAAGDWPRAKAFEVQKRFCVQKQTERLEKRKKQGKCDKCGKRFKGKVTDQHIVHGCSGKRDYADYNTD